jgi:hypothetical protein
MEFSMSSSIAPAASATVLPQIAMTIESAGRGWGLLMQSGAGVLCTVGIPLKKLLHEEFGLTPEQSGRIDVMLLDGKPVDMPETTIVPHGARLALAAGLPGIAGLAMKSGSAVRGLRPGITFRADERDMQAPGSGMVELVLFSLALGLLAGHFLARGVVLRGEQLTRYARKTGNETCLFCGQARSVDEALEELDRMPADTPVLFTARLRG